MSALQLIVTAAGKAAIVNAENTGTGPVLVSQIGLTDQVFTANAATAALPGEVKRLSTFAGAAVADDTIHVTIRDDSPDSYTLRGFGLYTAAGVLFAVYSHAGETPDYIMQKASAAMLLLAADVRFTDINATSIAFGDADWINPPGTETVPGVLELATDAETATGTDDTRVVHPKGLKALLDSRFGAGAPTAFVKGLLSLATATLIRAALELKSAALKDEGPGNGLDADLLDGQHGSHYLAWANLTGTPSAFAPSAHTHTWADINDAPATATRWPAWGEVSGKPSTFAPTAHTHAAGDITSGILALERLPALPVSQVTNLQQLLDAKAKVASPTFTGTATFNGTVQAMMGNIGISAIPETGATYWLRDENSRLRGAVQWDRATDSIRIIRHNDTGSAITSTLSLLANGSLDWNGSGVWHAANFDPTTKANASHSHGIEGVTGLQSALDGKAAAGHTHTIANVSGLQSALDGKAAASHTHAIANVTGLQGALDSKANSGANVGFADITASRGNGSGVIFLGGGSRYLYYNGSGYEMPGAGLTVGGWVSAPGFAQSSSRRYKRDIETITPEEALELLATIRLVRYSMRADGSSAMGVVAEELADGPLDFVVTRTENGDPEGVNYQPLFVIASAALQGIVARVSALEQKA